MSNKPADKNSEPSADLARQLSLAIKASQALLILAQADDWQDFELQFRQRDILLQNIDTEVTRLPPLSVVEADVISDRLQQLRGLNDQLVGTATARKNVTLAELAKDRSARKALTAYSK